MINGAAMGEVFDGKSFDTFDVSAGNQAAFDACKRVAVNGDRGIVIFGSNGLGKSHLLASLAKEFHRLRLYAPPEAATENMVEIPSLKELMDMQFDDEETAAPYLLREEIHREAHVEFWPSLDLVAALRKDVLEGQVVERCMRCDLLLLDDIGREKVNDFIGQEFQRIIDYRWRMKRTTAIATNMSRTQIAAKYGAHTASRLADACEFVDVKGDDYRIKRNKGA